MSSVARYLGLQSPKSKLYVWKNITFQLTEVDENYKPTQKIVPDDNKNRYKRILFASPDTKLSFKVRNDCSVPTRILLAIKSHDHIFYKTIILKNNSYYDLVCMQEDCSLEIMHIGLDSDEYCQEDDKFIFQVTGLPPTATAIWHNDTPIYYPNKKKLSWGVIDFFLSEYDQNGNQIHESSLYLPENLKKSVKILTKNVVHVTVTNNCFVRVRLVLKKTDIRTQVSTYRTNIYQPRETRDYFIIDKDTTVQVMHISIEDGIYSRYEQSDLLIDFERLDFFDMKFP